MCYNLCMKILMVSSEVFPHAVAGGLAEVIPNLSRELSTAGHQVKILLPRYYNIDRLLLEKHPEPMSVQLGEKQYWTELYKLTLANSEVELYFLDCEQLYGRDGIYGEKNRGEYPDNLERFALLSRSTFHLCRLLGWYPDILHAHDWPTALCMTYLKHYENSYRFEKTRGIFSIHNFGYQGLFPGDQLPATGFDMDEFVSAGFEFHGRINLMKSALINADAISTVSRGYAREIQSKEYGFGLQGVISRRTSVLRGILNGCDYETWNPSRDQHIPCRFDDDSMENKALNKNFLQEEAGLEMSSRPPLIGMVSRLVDQKGYRMLLGKNSANLRRICTNLDVQLIVLGTGEKWIEEGLREAAAEFPNLRVYIHYNEKMSHIIQAASDFFLIPSLYEPCGLTQMYALRYGSIPIVTRTGGLRDTIIDFDEDPEKGNGILIDLPLDEDKIYHAVEKACALWKDNKSRYDGLQKKTISARFSWKEAASKYLNLYSDTINARPS